MSASQVVGSGKDGISSVELRRYSVCHHQDGTLRELVIRLQISQGDRALPAVYCG